MKPTIQWILTTSLFFVLLGWAFMDELRTTHKTLALARLQHQKLVVLLERQVDRAAQLQEIQHAITAQGNAMASALSALANELRDYQ